VNAADGSERTRCHCPDAVPAARFSGRRLTDQESACDRLFPGLNRLGGQSHRRRRGHIERSHNLAQGLSARRPAANGVISGAFLPNGELHVVHQTVRTRTAIVWNVTTNREVWRTPSDTPRFSSTGRHVYGPVDGRLDVWSYPDRVRVSGWSQQKATDRGIDVLCGRLVVTDNHKRTWHSASGI
jgi:hypothetical protein